MLVGTNVFSGTAPRVGSKLLRNEQAQVAKNCDLRSGELRARKNTSSVTSINGGPTIALDTGTIRTIFLYENLYLWSWDDVVNIVRGPVEGDTSGRVYWTGDTADSTKPKMGYSSYSITGTPPVRYPAASYRLGIPKPAAAPSLALGAGGGCAAADQVNRAYVYTYVSALGEEGPPSNPGTIASVCPGQTVDLSAMSTAPSGPYNVTNKNIYRSVTGTNGTEYQFVAQIAVATTTYSDTKTDSQLGEVLPSTDWIPPVDTLTGITALSSGMLAGFSGKDVWISEPFVPHAWPNRQAVNFDVVGLSGFGTSLVALTKGAPYIATGTDPSALNLEMVNIEQACVAARSIARFGESGVIYASPDGLVLINAGGARVLTEQYLTAKEWSSYKPDSIHGYVHDGQYFGFYDTGSVTGGFIFDPRENGAGLQDLTTYATAGHVDLLSDSLYLVVSGSLVKWEGNSTLLTHTWKSKTWELPRHTNLAWGQVTAKSYASLTCKVYADGVLKHTQTVTSNDPFRLPSGFLARDWELELSGTDTVTSAYLANSITELRNVSG